MSAAVVVIGGGVNGLVCATLLARAGRRVTLVERQQSVGGAALTRELAPGFRVPALAHSVGPLRADVARDLGLGAHGLEFVRSDTWMTALDGKGRALALSHDTARSAAAIGAFSAKDAERWPAFVQARQRLGRVVASVFDSTPPSINAPATRELWGLLRTARQFRALGREDGYRLLRWGPMAVADLVAEYADTDLLRAALVADGVLGSAHGPWSAGSGLLFLLHAANDVAGDARATWPRGGPGAFADALRRAAEQAGVTIQTGARVVEIVTAAGKARGVRVDGGATTDAALVVSGIDPKSTFALCDPMAMPSEIRWRAKNYRSRGTLAKLNLALSAMPVVPGADREQLTGRIRMAPDVDAIERAYDHIKYGRYSPAPWLEAVIPSLVDSSLAPAGAHVMSVYAQYAPAALREGPWSAVREPFLHAILDTLDRYMPGIRGLIVEAELITPADLELTWGLTGGDIHHGELALDQLFTMRPLLDWSQYRTPVDGLWLCGAGTHPGLGLTGGSGANAAREILKRT